jgi:hypothetical protein
MHLLITLLLISNFAFAEKCKPYEIFIHEQKIESYSKEDGTIVSAHIREAHCRKIPVHSYFQDTTSQKFLNINPKLKPWSQKEKIIVDELLNQLPTWLKQYKIAQLLRSHSKIYDNPAYTIDQTKTIILSDAFFQSTAMKDILTHEVAHLALSDFSDVIREFWQLSGWVFVKELNIKLPPTKLIINDSAQSITEDFANHIEVYHFKPAYLGCLIF